MIDRIDIVREYAKVASRGQRCVVATVVETRGSAYRRAGARLIMAEGVHLAGAISGGCLEGDVMRKAWWRSADGACVVRYDSTGGDGGDRGDDDDGDGDELRWGFGLGCNGVIDVLLERLTPGEVGDPLAFLRRCLDERRRGVIATVIRRGDGDPALGARLLCDESGVVASTLGEHALAAAVGRDAAAVCAGAVSRHCDYGSLRVFHELIVPPPELVVCGGGYDAVPMMLQAKALGWRVVIVVAQALPSTAQRFRAADRIVVAADATTLPGLLRPTSRSAAVIMSHHYERDRALVDALLGQPFAYVGLLGPARRAERILGELTRSGRPPSAAGLGRLHAPMGLDVGAEGADEIALATVAEVQARLAQRAGRSLRQSYELERLVQSADDKPRAYACAVAP